MSELRRDPFSGRFVVIAPERNGIGAVRAAGLPASEACPFCPGQEAQTEATIAAWPSQDQWRVRVVNNRFPIVSHEDTAVAEGARPARGRHEIVIESDVHGADLADLDDEHAGALVDLWRRRVAELESDEGTGAVVLFRNRGRRAGSSQPHPHSQIAALGWVPVEIALRWERAREHYRSTGRSLWASTLNEELEDETRIIAASDHVAMYCPFAPTRPWEVRLSPRQTGQRFAEATSDLLHELGRSLVDAHRRLRVVLGELDYNVILRQPPARASGPAVGWHLEILPRLGGDAGFELATSCMIVVVAPEHAAGELRRCHE